MKNLNFTIDVSKRIILFLCVTLLCLILGSVVIQIIMHGGLTTPRLRIAAIFQDITFFIIPSITTAILICRKPAEFLMVNKLPELSLVVVTIGVILASVPMMNSIIEWNMSIQLPDSLKSIEEWMKSAEKNAANVTEILLGGTGIKSYIVALLIVAILAGFSEEIFFRGTIQRLLSTSGVNIHAAVWITAFLFSAIHLQFYGFVPRLLLGVFFGYAVAWSGNIWLGIIAHFTNNAIAAAGMTIGKDTSIAENVHSTVNNSTFLNSPYGYIAIIISVLLTLVLIAFLRKLSRISCD
ncbi:MAG: CPBP family intramembrane metalloprotease [Paramuribaculum sp.]|nr:CPBP family intramembrane metalloprotease [Paramuribaculum sp.]